MALDLADVRAAIETGLTDEPLQRLLDDAVGEVESRFGTDDPLSVTLTGGTRLISVLRPIASGVTVTERWKVDGDPTILTTDDYEIHHKRNLVKSPREVWAPFVTITYTPVPEETLRERVAIDLIKLGVQFNGTKSETVGDYQMTIDDYHDQRERILGSIARRRGFRIA